MLQIPQHILENLSCSICDGYLSSKPLMVRHESEQVCGKCYSILPPEEKVKYHSQGCKYEYSWGENDNHEVECPYRFLLDLPTTQTLVHSSNLNDLKSELTCKSGQIEATLKCELKHSKYHNEVKNLSYSLKLKGDSNSYLTLKSSENSREMAKVELNVDGSIFIGSKPEIVYMDVKVEPRARESNYEYLWSTRSYENYCFNCRKLVYGFSDEKNMCMECIAIPESELRGLCKNFRRGCELTLQKDELHRHQTDCQFNDFECPVESCNLLGTLPNIKSHLAQSHSKEIHQKNEFTGKFYKKDKTIIFFFHESLFKCVYNYYKMFVEFYVSYIGPSENCKNWFFEVIASSGGNVFAGKSKCSSWNNAMLEKGVTFFKDDIVCDEQKFSFNCKIRIFCV